MADNTVINAGTGGDPIATDDITAGGVANGAKVQRVKIGVGVDGAYADVTSSNPLPVDGTVVISGTPVVAPAFIEYTATASASGVSIGSIDVSAYQSFSLQLVNGSSNNFIVEGSNNNADWSTLWTLYAGSSSAASLNKSGGLNASNSPHVGWVFHRYLRVRCTSYFGPATTLTLELYARPLPTPVASADSNGFQISVAQAVNSDTMTPSASQGSMPSYGLRYNGSTWERQRTATAGAGTTGTGIPAAGVLGFDGTNYQRVKTDTAGVVNVREAGPATSTLANVAGSATSVTLLASNTARRGAYVFNDSTALLYVKLGATASSTSHTVQVAAGQFYELPMPVYTGVIDGIWASAAGSARVTELT